MDEEEIIKRRDDAASSDDPLASDDRRALADAGCGRSLSRSGHQGGRAGRRSIRCRPAGLPAGCSSARASATEMTFRADRHVFARLMTLRSALDAQPDLGDLRRADDPARAIRRHVAGRDRDTPG